MTNPKNINNRFSLVDYFPLIRDNKITAERATQECIDKGMTYALEYFSPQTHEDLPYWDMLDTNTYQNWKQNKDKNRNKKPKQIIANCGCIIEKELTMTTIKGTSCPNCYDLMSD